MGRAMIPTHHSYEHLAWAASRPPTPPDPLPVRRGRKPTPQFEAYAGTAIVGWWNTVKNRLLRMAEEQEANRNTEYTDLIRTFHNTWTSNPITGSINRETLDVLKAAAAPLSVLKWSQASYFAGLATSLDMLIADQEALPTGVPNDNAPFTAGAGFSSPPMNPSFGPGDMPPPGSEPGTEPGPEAQNQDTEAPTSDDLKLRKPQDLP